MKRLLLLSLFLLWHCQQQNATEQPSEEVAEAATSTQVQSSEPKQVAKNDGPPFQIQDSSKVKELGEGLLVYIVEEGSGNIPKAGDQVVVHYYGTLQDGTKFDSSYDRGEPFRFVLGRGSVIQGWERAFAALPVGTKAVLVIPPHLGYGNRSVGPIPPNAVLIFYVHLLGVDTQ